MDRSPALALPKRMVYSVWSQMLVDVVVVVDDDDDDDEGCDWSEEDIDDTWSMEEDGRFVG